MPFNAYLVFKDSAGLIKGESSSCPDPKATPEAGAIEIVDYTFGATMPVTTSRSDGGGATVGRAAFDAFGCNKGIDNATCALFQYCCKGTVIESAVLHLYRQGDSTESGAVKFAMVVFQHLVITKVSITGGGDELPKEALEFNYGRCEYIYQKTNHETGKPEGDRKNFGWSTITNKENKGLQNFANFVPDAQKKET